MIKYVHTNLIASDWRRLADFYQSVFDCVPVKPERDLHGEWLDRATGLEGARIRGIHLRFPGYGLSGPTLEIFSYDDMPDRPTVQTSTPGFTHIAFAVDDVPHYVSRVESEGGRAVGELARVPVDGVGHLVFQYVADPEGNHIELQAWS